MATSKPLNLIISGLGGQGVFVLTKTVFHLCAMKNLKCQSSTFKGGAQKHGSIHSVLRIFAAESQDYDMHSTQILPGELNVMIGLEPWETLRYHTYFGKRTRIYMNSEITPFYQERKQQITSANPINAVNDLKLPALIRDFTAESIHTFGSGKMLNYLIGLAAIQDKALPFSAAEYTRAFITQVRLSEDMRSKVLALGAKE